MEEVKPKLEIEINGNTTVTISTNSFAIQFFHDSPIKTIENYRPNSPTRNIVGIIGFIQLKNVKCLIVISDCSLCGKIFNKAIWKITNIECIILTENSQLISEDKKYIELIEDLTKNNFYFSNSFDITNRLQNQFDNNQNSLSHKKYCERFFWNQFLLEPIISIIEENSKFNQFILPIMMGYIQINHITINSKNFDLILISRRNKHRSGTRFFQRGIDENGVVANNVETEQIVTLPNFNKFASFVLIRGSIPLLWSQPPTTAYTPKIVTKGTPEQNTKAFELHFQDLQKTYGQQTLVNLINHKGIEKILEESYSEYTRKYNENNNGNLKYIAFDFHHECKGMKYHNISKLINQINSDIENYGYFCSDDNKIVKSQSGTFRVNCIDNLDRTNVIQSAIAREALADICSKFEIIQSGIPIKDIPQIETVYKDMWANNADVISFQYSGTGALKNDFTRTGKRTIKGALADGYNSVTRYYINNFCDGKRQDAFDLFTGRHNTSILSRSVTTNASPFKGFFTISAAIFLTAFILSYFTPTGNLSRGKTANILIGLISTFFGYQLFKIFGNRLVNRPTLGDFS
eukprot:TRINITY_DN344_c2_g1_i1.p1 TRINITY_DN344_c2_g1~~TRINITY_DN344_c2_g1_i1.p1  ORF type:complete len:590 (+),score=188.30 TRINITY_DN344_c2_g1_i1:42-1772(+)